MTVDEPQEWQQDDGSTVRYTRDTDPQRGQEKPLSDRDDTFRVGADWQAGASTDLSEIEQEDADSKSKTQPIKIASFIKQDATGQPEVEAKGPEITKGREFQQSEVDILKEVRQRLVDHPGIDASNMYVELKRGVVTLRGAAASQDEKCLAEDVVSQIANVTEVINELQIHQNKPLHTGGPEIQGRPD